MILIGIVGSLIESCINNESDNISNTKNKDQFMTEFNHEINLFFKSPITSSTSRGDFGGRNPVFDTVYVDLLDDDGKPHLPIAEIKTPEELLILVRDFNATFSFEDDGSGDSIIVISDEDANSSLAPLITKSKQYLYEIGFTETEIQEMLNESDATDAELVPLVITLIEQENEGILYARTHSFSNHFFIFSQKAYAQDISWEQAGLCAFKVIGGEIIDEIKASGAKRITKTLVKKVFKTVAKRLLGPVGALIAVVEFGECLFLN